MKTIVHTQIYEIRESAKGWSQPLFFYFNKEQAEECLEYCKQRAKVNNDKRNFKLVTRKCEDSIIYTIHTRIHL